MATIIQFPRSKMSQPIWEVPIIRQALFLLRHADEEKGIKITERGYLNRSFVQAFWDTLLKEEIPVQFRPSREQECLDVTRLRALLAEAAYIQVTKGTLRLTPKGLEALDAGRHASLYRELLWIAMARWNWSYGDRYPDYEFIQEAGPHLLRVLREWPSDAVTPRELFHEAFEWIEEGNKPQSAGPDELDSYFDNHEIHCLQTRFFERFCVPFGLLKANRGTGFDRNLDDPYQRTPFLMSALSEIVSQSP